MASSASASGALVVWTRSVAHEAVTSGRRSEERRRNFFIVFPERAILKRKSAGAVKNSLRVRG
jgi:hypothetical protein